jgi:DNA-3-methyladenine glycosylase II
MSHTIHLGKDKRFKKLIETHGELALKKRKNLCTYLCASIMSQQLSTKVATVIHQRFIDLYGGKEPTPEQIIATPPATLRAIGLSNAKAAYVQNVARFSMEQGMDHKKLSKMTDEEVIEYLTQIKGVGRWTAEMLLMFALGREDVFAIDDLGIQNAMIRLYKLDREDKKAFREKMLTISKKWSPYRSYACMYLWRSLDNTPIK